MPITALRARLPFQYHGSRYWLITVTTWICVTASAFWYATYVAHHIEQQAKDAAFARAEVGAKATEQSLARLLEATETLHDLAQARQNLIEAGLPSGISAIETQLATAAQRGRFGVLQVAIISPDGWLSWSSVPNWQPVQLGDREHFRHHIHSDDGIFVSAPLMGRASRRLSVQLSRRLSNSTGDFMGVAVVSVDAQQLSQDLAALQFGEGAIAFVARRDGVTVASSQGVLPGLHNAPAADTRVLQALSVARVGRIELLQAAQHERFKILAYRALIQPALFVAVALDYDHELAPVTFTRALLIGAATAISALTLVALALTLLWLERRQTLASLHTLQHEQETAKEQLVHIQRMEALGRLAGGIAHDFNNVLQVVLGGAKGISRRSSDISIRRLAGMVIEAAERGASVTHRLLAFARRGELRTEIVHLASMLAGLREVLTHTLGTDVTVQIEVAPDLPAVMIDKGQLETVLVNLAVNARDAMAPLGGGTLTVKASLDTIALEAAPLKPGRYVRLAVIDTGAGMDPATLARAVEPFFTTKARDKGTGLGLAMAKGFAEQSGGSFQLESEVGVGTTATLWVPCLDHATAHVRNHANLTMPADCSTRSGMQGLRVLMVDDEALVRDTLAENLGALDWKVSVASGATTALTQLEDGASFDLLITDLAMPGMDGLSLIRAVRSRLPGLPSILLTGHAEDAPPQLLAVAEAGGPFALLRKPVDLDELTACVETLIPAQMIAHQPDAPDHQDA